MVATEQIQHPVLRCLGALALGQLIFERPNDGETALGQQPPRCAEAERSTSCPLRRRDDLRCAPVGSHVCDADAVDAGVGVVQVEAEATGWLR